MSALRTTPVPLKVGSNTAVFRGIGNLRERFPRRAGDRVERVRLAAFVHEVVEERAEFGGRQLRGGVGHRLHDPGPVQVGRDDGADVVQGLRDRRALLEQSEPLGLVLFQRRDVTDDLRRADDRAGVVAYG